MDRCRNHCRCLRLACSLPIRSFLNCYAFCHLRASLRSALLMTAHVRIPACSSLYMFYLLRTLATSGRSKISRLRIRSRSFIPKPDTSKLLSYHLQRFPRAQSARPVNKYLGALDPGLIGTRSPPPSATALQQPPIAPRSDSKPYVAAPVLPGIAHQADLGFRREAVR